MSYVWIDMLTYDEQAAAQRAADKMDRDPRVRHFHDARRACGQAVARSLGAEPGITVEVREDHTGGGEVGRGRITWTEEASADMHSSSIAVDPGDLGDGAYTLVLRVGWADRARYHTGDDLVAALGAMVERFLSRE